MWFGLMFQAASIDFSTVGYEMETGREKKKEEAGEVISCRFMQNSEVITTDSLPKNNGHSNYISR